MDKFEIRFDPQMRRMHWIMRGFWTLDDVAAFAAALRSLVATLGPPPQHFDGLSDARGFPVQSGEVSAALGEIERAGRTMQSGMVASVVGSVTNKLQVERTMTGEHIRVFLDYDEAVAWLDAQRRDD